MYIYIYVHATDLDTLYNYGCFLLKGQKDLPAAEGIYLMYAYIFICTYMFMYNYVSCKKTFPLQKVWICMNVYFPYVCIYACTYTREYIHTYTHLFIFLQWEGLSEKPEETTKKVLPGAKGIHLDVWIRIYIWMYAYVYI